MKARNILVSSFLMFGLISSAQAASTAVFECGKATVTANFNDNDSLSLQVNKNTYLLYPTMSGSGARYATPKGVKPYVLFWNKGDDATLQVGNRKFPSCHTKIMGE